MKSPLLNGCNQSSKLAIPNSLILPPHKEKLSRAFSELSLLSTTLLIRAVEGSPEPPCLAYILILCCSLAWSLVPPNSHLAQPTNPEKLAQFPQASKPRAICHRRSVYSRVGQSRAPQIHYFYNYNWGNTKRSVHKKSLGMMRGR